MTIDTKLMKHYYEKGLWAKHQLDMLLESGKIIPDQYNEIIGGK